LKVLHAYCLNHNLGDYYLGMGVKNILRNYLDVELIAETNLQGTVFDDYYIENVVNKKYDLLVIGGGGVIHGPHWPNGWFWIIREELIRRISIPILVYGVGYNYFAGEGGIPSVGKSHLIETVKRSLFFSVRNDGSLGRLKEQIDIEVPEVPDPGFHINLNRDFVFRDESPFVLVQVADDYSDLRFSNAELSSQENREHFVIAMREAVVRLSKRYTVVLSPHVQHDIRLSEQISQGISNTRVWDFQRYAFDRASESVGYYENAEFVIAMRGHGQIVPMAFSTPVISVENHPKHGGLMRKLGLEDYNIRVGSEDFTESLLHKIHLVESNSESYSSLLGKINESLASETDRAFSEIRSRLNS
jgi:polysaccharide pyruvyl transferase WcaK-like protein